METDSITSRVPAGMAFMVQPLPASPWLAPLKQLSWNGWRAGSSTSTYTGVALVLLSEIAGDPLSCTAGRLLTATVPVTGTAVLVIFALTLPVTEALTFPVTLALTLPVTGSGVFAIVTALISCAAAEG